jgi:hypothetical protein
LLQEVLMAGACAPREFGVLACVVSEEDVVALLRVAVAEAGSMRAFARAHGVNEGDLGQTIRGRRAPTSSICRAVGVERRLVLTGAVDA